MSALSKTALIALTVAITNAGSTSTASAASNPGLPLANEVKYYVDNAAQLATMRTSPYSFGSVRQYGAAISHAPTMLYSRFVASDLGSSRTDVSPRRIVQVLVTGIRVPTSLISGRIFLKGTQTLLIDAQTGDVLLMRLSGPAASVRR